MKIYYCSLWLVVLLLVGCEPQTNDVRLLDDAPEAKLIVTEKIMSPQERALQNKIAARALLQQVIDQKEATQKEDILFECSTTTGGLLTKIKTEEQWLAIKFAQTEAATSNFYHLYYNNNQLQLVVHEIQTWQGETQQIVQTILYLEQGMIFHCLTKKATANVDNIEQAIATAPLDSSATPLELWEWIQTEEIKWQQLINKENIAHYYCS